MNGQLQTQTSAWWQLITSGETLGTYQKALDLTWRILQETAKLLWLVLCLGLVAFTAFWNGSIALGRGVRAWVDQVEEPKSSHLLPEAGRTALALGKTAGLLALWQAREQLGLANAAPRPTLASTLATLPKKSRLAVAPASPAAEAAIASSEPPVPAAPPPASASAAEAADPESSPADSAADPEGT